MGTGHDGRLLGGTGESPEWIVLHVDMDCFYAACERLREPALRGEPVVIGMGYEEDEPHGAVATASYEARTHGIESAMPISEALEKLPRRGARDDPDVETGFYRPVDMGYYKSVSREVRSILDGAGDVFEPVSIDEAYLDVTERTTWQEVDAYAEGIKREIAEDVGVTASIGVAPTKSAAKVASDRDKPHGLVVVPPGEVRSFFDPLDIETVHGIGPVTAGALRKMGIGTAGDLADADPSDLESRFGSRGREFYDRARGNDPRPVSPPDDPKSLSRESSTGEPITDIDAKRDRIRRLAADVADRAREQHALYQTVGIKVVVPPYEINTRAHSLSGPVDDPEIVESIALDLLDEFGDVPVRKLGVRVSNLSFSDRRQSALDGWAGEGNDVDPSGEIAGGGRRRTGPTQRTLSEFS